MVSVTEFTCRLWSPQVLPFLSLLPIAFAPLCVAALRPIREQILTRLTNGCLSVAVSIRLAHLVAVGFRVRGSR
jgi:hypothetical protein